MTAGWYHGTGDAFDAFDAFHVGKGNDQLGSGFYFTDRFETAVGYARRGSASGGFVAEVDLAIGNPLPEDGVLDASAIGRILAAAPDLDDVLENFGDVAHDGREKVLRMAVEAYRPMADGGSDPLDCLNAISNDFWRGHEGDFLRTVVSVTGHDGLLRPAGEETHAVAWTAEQVTIRRWLPAPAPTPAP